VVEALGLGRLASALAAAALLTAAGALDAAAQSTPPAAAGSVTGRVLDSLTAAPLAGAAVQLVSRARQSLAYAAATDSAGRFHLDGVAPGEYVAGFFHAVLDSLGVEDAPHRLVRVAAGAEADVALAVPSGRTLARAHCGKRPRGDSAGVLLGHAMDADTRAPLPGAKVVVTWSEVVIDQRGLRREQRRAPTVARGDGLYVLCGLPSDADMVADATLGPRRSGAVEARVPPFGLARRDFTLGDSVSAAEVAAAQRSSRDSASATAAGVAMARGSARLSGRVRTLRGQPVAGALVMVWGSDVTGRTDADGGFALLGLPAGTYTLEARAIGFAPKRVPVELSSTRATAATVTLDEPVALLTSVTVYGRPPRRSRDLTGFVQRSQQGGGHFVTREDIDRRNPTLVTDLFRGVSGVQVVSRGGMGYDVLLRGGCRPVVFVDGVPVRDVDIDMVLYPRDLIGIEIYSGPAATPAQFNQGVQSGNCGTVVIWTRQ